LTILCPFVPVTVMGVDLHQKVGGDHGQNINRMPIWEIRTVVTKTSIRQIPWSVSIQIHTESFFTSNTDWKHDT